MENWVKGRNYKDPADLESDLGCPSRGIELDQEGHLSG